MRRTWPEQRRHVVVCLMRYQLANYSSGSFTWSSKSIQLNFVGILKTCEKKNGAAERFTAEQVAPSDFGENEYETPSDFDENDYETKWKQRRRVCWRPSRSFKGLQDVLDVDGHTWYSCRYHCKLHALFMNHDEVKSGRFLRLKPWKGLIAGLLLQVQICTDLAQIEKLMTKMNDAKIYQLSQAYNQHSLWRFLKGTSPDLWLTFWSQRIILFKLCPWFSLFLSSPGRCRCFCND